MNLIKYDDVNFLVVVINYQLNTYPSTKSFRYQSYLLHLILFNNLACLQRLGLTVMDDIASIKPMMEWTNEIRMKEKNQGFTTYVDKYMSFFFIPIHRVQPSRMFNELNKFLLLTKETITGD
jgi:hypothetical protein